MGGGTLERAQGPSRRACGRARPPQPRRGTPLSSHTACTAGSSGWVGALGGPGRPGRGPAPQQPTSDSTPTAPSTAPRHGQACPRGTARGEGGTETGPPADGAGPAPQSVLGLHVKPKERRRGSWACPPAWSAQGCPRLFKEGVLRPRLRVDHPAPRKCVKKYREGAGTWVSKTQRAAAIATEWWWLSPVRTVPRN